MTRIDLDIKKAKKSSSCLGSGFIALDVVQGAMGDFAAAGGSCGNVVSILAWLGWTSSVGGRLKNDVAGEFIRSELEEIGVDTSYLSLEEKGVSPIVIQRFVEDDDGSRTHRFSLTCPDCKGWLPRYRAMTQRHAEPIIDSGQVPNAYYFDRANPATLKLAKWAREQGAVIFFEPSSVSEARHFEKAVDLCHVLKFSSDRLGHVPDLGEAGAPKIVIRTEGEAGLTYRWKSRWTTLPAFVAPVFKDAAGSGDWCSAGLIHHIAANGAGGLKTLRKTELERGLRFGQALATINCGFEGARGAMTALSHQAFNKALRSLTISTKQTNLNWAKSNPIEQELPEGLCFSCSTTPKNKKSKARA